MTLKVKFRAKENYIVYALFFCISSFFHASYDGIAKAPIKEL